MRRVRKLVALLLSLAMVLAMSGVAMAAATLEGGEVGGFTQADTPNVDNKVVNIAKEITVFNPDEGYVYGPAITYTYTVTPGTANVSITDATSDHSPATAVTSKTISGITTGVVVNGGTAGDTTSAVGTLAWTNSEELEASSTGTANTKLFTVDFSNVVFTAPGVYRYTITETPAAADAAYASAGITETNGTRIRYLDVYVMRSSTFTDLEANGGTAGKTAYVAADWRVYGFVCVYDDNDAITPDGDTTTLGAMKTNGFVSGTNDGTVINADQYHTFNLTVGKTLTGDTTMNSHKFPFDVAWTAGTATGTFQFGVKVSGTATVTSTSGTNLNKVGGADAIATDGKDGNPSIATGGTVKYIGIPTGTKVTVTETNDVVGTTYSTTVTDAGASVAWTGGDSVKSTDNLTATMENGKTAAYAQAAAPAADTNVTIQVTNKLETISPTGLMFRYGPYVLILLCGALLLFLGVKFMRRNKEED